MKYKKYFIKLMLNEDLLNILKSFLFHNIKYGKHLKLDKNIINYNNILIMIPKLSNIEAFGPFSFRRKKINNEVFIIKKEYLKFKKNKIVILTLSKK